MQGQKPPGNWIRGIYKNEGVWYEYEDGSRVCMDYKTGLIKQETYIEPSKKEFTSYFEPALGKRMTSREDFREMERQGKTYLKPDDVEKTADRYKAMKRADQLMRADKLAEQFLQKDGRRLGLV